MPALFASSLVDPTLAGRAQLTGVAVAGEFNDGWVGLELEVDVSQ
jgi:hypothetical protein